MILFVILALTQVSSRFFEHKQEFDQGLVSQNLMSKDNLKFMKKRSRSFHHLGNQYVFTQLNEDPQENLNPSVRCKPASYGVLSEKSQTPERNIKQCERINGESSMSIDENSRIVNLNCESNKKPFLIMGPSSQKFASDDFKGLISLNNRISETVEFVIGACANENSIEDTKLSNSFFEVNDEIKIEAIMMPVFNNELFEQTVAKKKPKIVVLVNFEFMSRLHFYRNFPQIIEFLNNSETTIPDYAVYDFKLYTTFASKPFENQLAIIEGLEGDEENNKKDYGKENLNENEKNRKLWKAMKEKGVRVLGC